MTTCPHDNRPCDKVPCPHPCNMERRAAGTGHCPTDNRPCDKVPCPLPCNPDRMHESFENIQQAERASDASNRNSYEDNLREVVERFIRILTRDGKNPASQLTIEHEALRGAIYFGQQTLLRRPKPPAPAPTPIDFQPHEHI